MSREIEFRGLNENGDFVYGLYVQNAFDGTSRNVAHGIQSAGCYPVEIDPNTLGQYTGLKDCNGVKIFEGDIVRHYHFTDSCGKVNYLHHIVKWSEKFSAWFLLNASSMSDIDGSIMLYQKFKERNYEVIGNIHKTQSFYR